MIENLFAVDIKLPLAVDKPQAAKDQTLLQSGEGRRLSCKNVNGPQHIMIGPIGRGKPMWLQWLSVDTAVLKGPEITQSGYYSE